MGDNYCPAELLAKVLLEKNWEQIKITMHNFLVFQVDVKSEDDSTTTGEFMFVPRYPTYPYQQHP